MNTNARHAYEIDAATKLAMADLVGNQGLTLAALTARGPTLVIFLRHLGCAFCR